MKPRRGEIAEALLGLEQLWRPPEEKAPSPASEGAQKNTGTARDYPTAPSDVQHARDKLTAARREFSRIGSLALKGKADSGKVSQALRAVDQAMAELREVEFALRAANRGTQ